MRYRKQTNRICF